MRKYIRKQLKLCKSQWDKYPNDRLKLIWLSLVFWLLLAPSTYLLLFVIGALTLQNPHRFASEVFNRLG